MKIKIFTRVKVKNAIKNKNQVAFCRPENIKNLAATKQQLKNKLKELDRIRDTQERYDKLENVI